MSNGSIQGQTYLSLQGGELQGNVEMNGNKITGLGEAVNDGDAVRFGQVKELAVKNPNMPGLLGIANKCKNVIPANSSNWVELLFDYVPSFIWIFTNAKFNIGSNQLFRLDFRVSDKNLADNEGQVSLTTSKPTNINGTTISCLQASAVQDYSTKERQIMYLGGFYNSQSSTDGFSFNQIILTYSNTKNPHVFVQAQYAAFDKPIEFYYL